MLTVYAVLVHFVHKDIFWRLNVAEKMSLTDNQYSRDQSVK